MPDDREAEGGAKAKPKKPGPVPFGLLLVASATLAIVPWFALQSSAAAAAVDALLTATIGAVIATSDHIVPFARAALVVALLSVVSTISLKYYQAHHRDISTSASVQPRLYWSRALQIGGAGSMKVPVQPGYVAAVVHFQVKDANQNGPVCYPDILIAVAAGAANNPVSTVIARPPDWTARVSLAGAVDWSTVRIKVTSALRYQTNCKVTVTVPSVMLERS